MLPFHSSLTHVADLPSQSFPWGTLTWLMNAQLSPGAAQTLGICHLFAGQSNSLHYHPNCEEILHVQQGRGKHLLDDQWFPVGPGDTVRIPAGVKHKLVNESGETMITIITFSTGDRQTVFLE